MASSLLAHAASPDAVNIYFFLGYVVFAGILRNQSFDNSCHHDAAYEIPAATAITGLSGGCLLILLVTMLGSPTSRRWQMRAAAWEFATYVVHAAFEASDASPVVCVLPLGGYSILARPQQPARIVFWLCTLAPAVWSIASLVQKAMVVRFRLFGAICILFATGSVAMFSDIFALWISTLLVTLIAAIGVAVLALALLVDARAQSKDESTRWLFAIAAPSLTVMWGAFPVWWFVAQFGLVTHSTEHVGWNVIAFFAKFVLSSVLVCGNFVEQASLIEAELAVYESQRLLADGRDEAKRLFVRYILHEIRVPLQGGQLAIQELQLGLDAGELIAAPGQQRALAGLAESASSGGSEGNVLAAFRDTVGTALASMSTVGKLLDDFLSLAKIEDGRMTFEPTDVLLEGLLHEATAVFTNSLRVKSLLLRVSLAPDAPMTVFTDGARLRQIIANYLSNAIKFSPQGGEIILRVLKVFRAPAVVLGAASEPDAALAIAPTLSSLLPVSGKSGPALRRASSRSSNNGAVERVSSADEVGAARGRRLSGRLSIVGWTTQQPRTPSAASTVPFLLVSVSDSGPGISADEIPQLFQPYAQIRAGVQQKGLGTGLGLAICKGIAELMGGAVGVTSQPGTGATFWVEVPLVPLRSSAMALYSSLQDATGTQDATGERTESTVASARVASARETGDSPSHEGGALSCSLQSITVVEAGGGIQPAVSVEPHTSARPVGLRIVSRAVVVDDVRSNRELFARLLRRAGADIVFTAEHGLDATTLLCAAVAAAAGRVDVGTMPSVTGPLTAAQIAGADALVDVWFVDGNMPVMDGLALTRVLRGAGVRAPIIAVTGNALAEDQAEFRSAGADVVLTKPLSATKLREGLASIGLSLPVPNFAPA